MDNPSNITAPCKGCKHRKTGTEGCHSDCEKYQKYKKTREKHWLK